MATVTIKIIPFQFAYFVHLDVPQTAGPDLPDIPMDVAEAFLDDAAAAKFWDELKTSWVKHVAARRAALSKKKTVG